MLGSGPTRDDVKQGEALSGHMGKEVRAALDEAGIRREEILVLHTYVCTAKEPKRDKEEKAATGISRWVCRAAGLRGVPQRRARAKGDARKGGPENGIFKR